MAKHTISDLYQMQSLPLYIKVRMTQLRIRGWIDEYGYFHFNAEDVEYIEAIDSTSGEYPYRLTVHLKSGNAPSVSYQDSKSRDTARNELVRLVDRVRHEDTEKILNQLTLLNYSNERIERRQLRIWRQLKALLGLSMEDE